MKILPLAFGYLKLTDASCPTNERHNANGQCVAKCDLFQVNCDVHNGWSLEVNEVCRKDQYPNLNFQGSSDFFINANSLNDGSTIDAASECKFVNGAISNLPFTSCNGFKHSQNNDYNYHTGYVNHRVNVGGVITSSMDEVTVECRMNHVQLGTGNDNGVAVGINDNDEQVGSGEIASEELIEKLGLALEVGTTLGGYKKIDGNNVDVGSQVKVKLTHSAGAPFSFSLRDCKAAAFFQEIDLYDVFCPNKESEVVELERQDSLSFNLNVFRINAATKLTFKCQVSLFPDEDSLPTCQSNNGRKRREINAITERSRRSTNGEVAITIDLSNADLVSKESGAIETCANFLIPSLFIFNLN